MRVRVRVRVALRAKGVCVAWGRLRAGCACLSPAHPSLRSEQQDGHGGGDGPAGGHARHTGLRGQSLREPVRAAAPHGVRADGEYPPARGLPREVPGALVPPPRHSPGAACPSRPLRAQPAGRLQAPRPVPLGARLLLRACYTERAAGASRLLLWPPFRVCCCAPQRASGYPRPAVLQVGEGGVSTSPRCPQGKTSPRQVWELQGAGEPVGGLWG